MMDREKVIKGLEWCMNEKHDCYREKGCPYENEGEDIGCKYALHRDALALLKAQEPVKPVFERQFMTSIEIYDCGKCGTSLGAKGIAKYCMNCGRAVKWE